jgi:ATP-dependent helicase/nuclease subunit A
VLAGAGTGKTSLLVERLLNAIGSGVAQMEAIAAITFTEKAAGEMRERLATGLDRLRALAGGAQDLEEAGEADRAWRHLRETLEIPTGVVASRALEAMERLDHGTVVTIHRFCAELLRAYPVEAGVDPGFVVDSGEWAESLGQKTWDEFVRRELGADAERPEVWERLLARLPIRDIGDVARKLSGFGIPSTLVDAEADRLVLAALKTEAGRIAVELDRWLEQRVLTPTGERCFLGFREVLDVLVEGDVAAARAQLRANVDLSNRVGRGLLGGTSKSAGREAAAAAGRVSNRARDFCRGILRVDDETFSRLVETVEPFVEQFRERYLRRGLVSFDGLLALARYLLRDFPEVRVKLKRRFGLVLVDEFQDTDPLQYEIVLFLAERVAGSADDAFRAEPEPGRLFVVGDAKQSIYRFRGADFAAYRRAVERIVETGGEALDLVGNFRSVPGIVEPVNELFDGASGCWDASAHQPEYVPIQPVRTAAADGPATEIWTVALERGTGADDRREAEGRVLAEAIERWVEQEGRYGYEQITILFRAFTNISHYLRPLRERGIPFVVDGGRDFLKRPEIGQLMATLRAVSRPTDPPSVLAYLRSPAGGASDVELAQYAGDGGRWSWWAEPDPKRHPNIARSFTTLRELWQTTRDLPADRFIRRVLERTLLLPLGAAAFEGPQRIANLQKLTAAAGELARDGTLSLEQVLEALEEGRLEDIETDRPLADDAARAVRITSIHRMKGLENDVVLLPDLARQRGSGEFQTRPVYVATPPGGASLPAIRAGGIENSARLWFDLEDDRHEVSEEVRVLYVALTRARERLVLIAAPSRGTTPWLDALEPWGYAPDSPPADGALLPGGRVRHRHWTPPGRQRPPERSVPEAATRSVEAYRSAVATLTGAARPPLAAPSGLSEDRRRRLDAGTGWVPHGTRASRDRGKAVGLVVHRLLEHWDGKEPERLTERLAVLCEDTARETRTEAAEIESDAREILEAFLATDLGGRLGRVERLGAELPLLVRVDERGPVFRGSIDLLYREAEGGIVVADYKTDRETDEDDLRRSYGRQLAVYAEAVQRALDLPERPRMELWLLRSGRVVTLDQPRQGPGDDSGPQQLSLW